MTQVPFVRDAVVELRRLTRFTRGLSRFLAHPVGAGEGLSEVRARIVRREQLFFDLLRLRVYPLAHSPYRALLRGSGIGLADVERSLGRHGLEATLRELAERGVYVSYDEFKARRPLIRHGRDLHVRESDFDNPAQPGHFEVRSGGTRGPATRVLIDFDYLTARAATTALLFRAHGLATCRHALWLPPGSGSFVNALAFAKVGAAPVRWFSQLDPRRARGRSRLVSAVMAWRARGLVPGWPRPETVPLTEAVRVAEWMARELAEGARPCLSTFASSAVRVCDAARAQGLDLRGAAFIAMSEPLTPARRAVIEATGARAIVHYGFTEGGVIGYSCPHATGADDVHLLEDLVACVARERAVRDGVSVNAYCVTSLLPAAPKILLNMEPGDYGRLERRACGCAFEAAGMRTHLVDIRSFEKLTGEGMTFVGSSLLRVLEETLPQAFGGRPIDYQLVEEEGAGALTSLCLVVHPDVGPLDEAAVRRRFFEALAAHNPWWRWMADIWSQAGTFRIVRRPPVTTAIGKVLPFTQQRRVG